MAILLLVSCAPIEYPSSDYSSASIEDVKTKDTGEVPMHIRNAPAEGMEQFGYHGGYKYPHDYPGHWVEQQYLPDKMLGTKYFVKDENVKE